LQTSPQRAFWASDARFRLFVGGRGSGKTRAGAVEAIRQPRGTTGLVVAPTYPMLRLGAMETILKLTAKAGIVTAWNKSEMELRLLGDRRIIFRSADNPDRLRGANAGWLWLDEVAMMNADIWPLSIATLRESPGRAWMTTTPRGKDWVYQLFDGDHRDYATIRSKTTDNMFLDDTFVATLKQSMTSEMYRQEVDGEFTDPVGSMFRREWLTVADQRPQGVQWFRYWDLASSIRQSADYTASVRVCLHNGVVYIADGIRIKAEWPDVRRIMIETMRSETDTVHGIEKAQHGLAATQELRRVPELADVSFRGIDVKGDKGQRAMPWAARAEQGGVRIVAGAWARDFLDEVVAFPSAPHDDYVDAASGAVAMVAKPSFEWSFR
jgi:PBSX family phage terminase large subunit